MLRRILISLGLLVALLPYLGFPHSWQAVISTIVGFSIVLVLTFSRPSRVHRESSPTEHHEEKGKELHIERMEIVERPLVHVERETVIDTKLMHGSSDTETTVEKKVVTTRRHHKTEAEMKTESSQIK